MTNKELRDVTERIRLENQLKKDRPIAKGKVYMQEFVKTVGTITAATVAAKKVYNTGSKYVSRYVNKNK